MLLQDPTTKIFQLEVILGTFLIILIIYVVREYQIS